METILARSIEAFGRDEWNVLFPGALEDWSYYRAVERANLAGFEWFYLAVWEKGRLSAAVPGFITSYRIDTTLGGTAKRVTNAIARIAPGLLGIALIALGSPVGEICALGFAPGASAATRARWTSALIEKLFELADLRRIGMVAIKDASAADDGLWSAACAERGLRRMPGQATAVLDLPFDSFEGYLASLGRATRRDLKRKLRAREQLRIEWLGDVDDIADRIVALYRATLARAEYRFEELTRDYFTGLLGEARGRAFCVVYWLDGKLIGFNLVLRDGDCLLDKFFGMDEAEGRAHNLYYVSWMENVRYAIEHGLARYQSGQGLEHEKLRLGSTLQPNWLWYRHRNPVVDRIFAGVERFFRLDQADAQPQPPGTVRA